MTDGRGFTLVEVIVAILILSVGLLGLVTTAAITTRMIAQGQRYSETSTLAAQQLEILRSQDCAGLNGGSRSAGAFSVTWTVSTVAGGRARALDVVVTSPTGHGTRADTFATTIPC